MTWGYKSVLIGMPLRLSGPLQHHAFPLARETEGLGAPLMGWSLTLVSCLED